MNVNQKYLMNIFVIIGHIVGSSNILAGIIESDLLEAGSYGEDVPVIIYLQNQPTLSTAKQIQLNYEPALKSLGNQVREILPETTPQTSLRTREEERNYLQTYVPNITQAQKYQIIGILEQIDNLSSQMRKEIYLQIKQTIDSEQHQLISDLTYFGGITRHKIISINAVSAIIKYDYLQQVAALPNVAYIELDRNGHPLLDISGPSINVESFWDSS